MFASLCTFRQPSHPPVFDDDYDDNDDGDDEGGDGDDDGGDDDDGDYPTQETLVFWKGLQSTN